MPIYPDFPKYNDFEPLPTGYVAPGRYPYLGDYLGWEGQVSLGDSDIFYGRIWLPEGDYDAMEVAITQQGNDESSIDMGVYACNCSAPPRPTGGLLASTGLQDVGGADDTFFKRSLSADLVVPPGGSYFWVAIVADRIGSTNIKVVSTGTVYRKVWAERIFTEKTAGGFPLGDLPESFNAPADTALPYIALIKKGM